MKRRIFLLGGYDLEMITIRDLLVKYGEEYYDEKLNWDNALLTAYQKVIDKYANCPDTTIYGIELRGYSEDSHLSNFRLIDHHNECSDRSTALVQVSELLNHTLSRYEQLIAANDSHYISGMEDLGATKKEINKIRYEDRKAQGVTVEDERLAEEAVQNIERVSDWLFVYSSTRRFSTITDRLYPYKNLFIYTDTEWMYYGERTQQVIDWFNSYPNKGSLFYGGGKNGFVGVAKKIYTTEDIKKIKEQIIGMI